MGPGGLCPKWSTLRMAGCLRTATARLRCVTVVSARAELPLLAPTDPGLDEAVDVAVEDRRRVADLVLGAQILDHLVRVQHVRAHLVTPGAGDVTAQRVELGRLL